MLHDAWYWFPWIQQMRLYWSLLATIVVTLVKARGIRAVFSSASLQGLIMGVFCGVFTSILFVQMFLVALPLRLLMGDIGSASNPNEGEVGGWSFCV